MDRLSSVLSAFRPRATAVTSVTRAITAQQLPLKSAACYWLYGLEGEVSLRDQHGKPLTLCHGEGVWLASGMVFTLTPTDAQSSAQLLICEYDFASKALNPLLDDALPWVKISPKDEIGQQLQPLNSILIQEFIQARCGSQVVLERLAEALLVQMLRLFMQTNRIPSGLLAGLSDAKLARAIVAIHEQPQQPWQLEDLAALAGMSRSSFSRAFRETLSMTPMAYLTLWRMRVAAQRLKNGDKNLALLSDELGYQSEAAFRRSFKKVMGVPPGAIRKAS
ncbi:helix-turn-helix domain-containing protein [Marinomonas aquiplantarum]|uniref:AraC family transcriptional regulator n=1 Tax=Marinomonas aquiplantarum TaxID=491951 RepID=A0A366D3Z6_9GAMM|nr:AraC family transcriptional regulator [Marinomonas aquiplantarum]RBO84793.1 AraC family transcriptional regulator [Marinomonas aquiplantarum]